MINLFRVKNKIISRFYGVLISIFLKKSGKNIQINSPLKIDGLSKISIDDNVVIGYKTWLFGLSFNDDCNLEIGSGTEIGNFNHIVALKSIKIGKNVLIADKVYISDNLHEYRDVKIPIIKQGVRQIGEVIIGDGTWIGENACVMGVSVGRNCVIGSNSVVTKDIPDYSVVVGSPAKVIKKYDFESKSWLKVK